jgi:hypothetical protein
VLWPTLPFDKYRHNMPILDTTPSRCDHKKINIALSMKLSRAHRFVAALIAVVSLLFAQLALASYVCPVTAAPAMTVMADDGMQEMTDCTGMDMQQPSLCHAHSHAGHQSLDKPDLPQVAPFVAIGPVLTVLPPDTLLPAAAAPSDDTFLTRATAPPLAIRHCCFRI